MPQLDYPRRGAFDPLHFYLASVIFHLMGLRPRSASS